MSNTRHKQEGTPLRQERYCSNPAFERGLMGNLVAKRCTILNPGSQRELIWFLQLLSHAPGGLAKVAADLVAMFPDRIASRSMVEFGFKPGQVYNAEQVKIVRAEIYDSSELPHPYFPLKGEIHERADWENFPSKEEQQKRERQYALFPEGYAASKFVEVCLARSAKLGEYLEQLCLNPDLLWGPVYFEDLIECLTEFKAAWIAERSAGQVITKLGQQVCEALDYSLKMGCMVLVDGLARTGKTHSVKAWCDLHPGQARYVQVPSSNDDIGFFRAIAKSLGVSINQNSKAQQLRDRVEEVLQNGDLALVLDEAHYLFPQSSYRGALPGRVNWIMTALVNHGVSVALITTPQFMRSQNALEKKSAWTSEQFTGRIGHYVKLPDSLEADDLGAVAKSLLPEACPKSVQILVAYARASAKYLAGIESAVRRARFLAEKESRSKVTASDVKRAITESAIPSDSALCAALEAPKKQGRIRTAAAFDSAPQVDAPPRSAPQDNLLQTVNRRAGAKSPLMVTG